MTIVGIGEDAPDGLPPASLAALGAAEIVMGAPRHLALLPSVEAELVTWPVPYADGIAKLLKYRGRRTVALASGDPFWFGAGTSITRQIVAGEWKAIPAPSIFSQVAARMGWPLEQTSCLGLHAAPLGRLRQALAQGARLIVLLRDGAAVAALAEYLASTGFGASRLNIFEALGGPRARHSLTTADTLSSAQFSHPVCAAIEVSGGPALPLTGGRPDAWFESDGQMTKRPIRALTLSALAPQVGEHLWDIGGGSGSIAIEWLLAHPSLAATSIEPRADRAVRIAENAARLGVDRLRVVQDAAPEALMDLPRPEAVFIGGGLSTGLLGWLGAHLAVGTRIVANAVTLESEAVLIAAQARHGGDLMRIELAQAAPIGARSGWKSGYPVVQWSAVL